MYDMLALIISCVFKIYAVLFECFSLGVRSGRLWCISMKFEVKIIMLGGKGCIYFLYYACVCDVFYFFTVNSIEC